MALPDDKLTNRKDLIMDYSSIDSSRLATANQFKAVAYHLAKLHDGQSENNYQSTKMFKAILYKFYTNANTRMTHGDVQKFFKAKTVPAKLKKMISVKKTVKKSVSKPQDSAPKTDDLQELTKLVLAQQEQIAALAETVKYLSKN